MSSLCPTAKDSEERPKEEEEEEEEEEEVEEGDEGGDDEVAVRKRLKGDVNDSSDSAESTPVRVWTPRVREIPPPKYSVFLQVMLSITVFTLCLWWSVPFIIICYGEVVEKWTNIDPPKIPVVVIGGYGDLAKKYLWQGLHNLDETYGGLPNSPLLLYSSGRAAPEVGIKKTSSALSSGVFCASGDAVCRDRKSAFVDRVSYRQLKTQAHFLQLCQEITQTTAGKEEGRIFYLSVPPFTYPEIVEYIDLHCRPPTQPPPSADSSSTATPPQPPWLRVVVEKPFGNDLQSAKVMSQDLLKHLKDEELYRIDHYLGKTTVRTILPFRHMNRGNGIEFFYTQKLPSNIIFAFNYLPVKTSEIL